MKWIVFAACAFLSAGASFAQLTPEEQQRRLEALNHKAQAPARRSTTGPASQPATQPAHDPLADEEIPTNTQAFLVDAESKRLTVIKNTNARLVELRRGIHDAPNHG